MKTIYGISSSSTSNKRSIFETRIVNSADSKFVSPITNIDAYDEQYRSPPSLPRRKQSRLYFSDESNDYLSLPVLDLTRLNCSNGDKTSSPYFRRSFPKPRSISFENANEPALVLVAPTPLRPNMIISSAPYENCKDDSMNSFMNGCSPTHDIMEGGEGRWKYSTTNSSPAGYPEFDL